MAVPKHRTSKSKRNKRRSHHGLVRAGSSACANCGDVKRPHSICPACGHYRGMSVLRPKSSVMPSDDAFSS